MTRRKLPLLLCIATVAAACAIVGIAQTATPAPAAFATPVNNDQSGAVSNGFTTNAVFAADEAVFMEEDDIAAGLGPVYNARSCVDCHAQPNVGATSQVTELRIGHTDGVGNFVNPTITINDGANTIPNRSLINDRAVCAQDSANVPGAETVRALRATTNVLGDGFVEAIDSNTLLSIANAQPGQSGGQIAGTFIQVPLSEAAGQVRAGRFGWKNQQASLCPSRRMRMSTSRASPAGCSPMRARRYAIRWPILKTTMTRTAWRTSTTLPGSCAPRRRRQLMQHWLQRQTQKPARHCSTQIGCNICHVTSITTSPAGTVINGGTFTVPAALGSKIIHPYSDFLLHNVGTGDGIVQNGGQATANMMRTAPLWGGRTRDRLMHDLQTFTRQRCYSAPCRRSHGSHQQLPCAQHHAEEPIDYIPAVSVGFSFTISGEHLLRVRASPVFNLSSGDNHESREIFPSRTSRSGRCRVDRIAGLQ